MLIHNFLKNRKNFKRFSRNGIFCSFFEYGAKKFFGVISDTFSLYMRLVFVLLPLKWHGIPLSGLPLFTLIKSILTGFVSSA